MWVKTKSKGKVYYDAEQKVQLDDKHSYEVKATGLIRELIRAGELVEADKPTDAQIAKYAEEDKAAKARKKANPSPVNKTVEGKLKKVTADLIVATGEIEDLEGELVSANEALVKANLEITALKEVSSNEALVKANLEITALKEVNEKVGDPKSQETKDLKAAAVDPKKETAKASNGEKA